jgi:colicin import membrane protein
MHLGLAVLLFFGVNWKSKDPAPVEVEVFTPPPAQVKAEPQPEKPVEKPVEKPAAKPVPPQVEKPEPDPDIVIAQKKKIEKAKLDAQKAEQLKQDKADKAEKEKLDKAKIEKTALEKEKLEKSKADKAKLEKTKLEKEKELEERTKSAAQQKAQEEAFNKRVSDLQSKASDSKSNDAKAANPGARTGASSSAGKGTDASYIATIKARIRQNTVFNIPEDLDSNPVASIEAKVGPDCSIVSTRIVRQSGLPAWDQAAERAVRRSSPLPKQADGSCPPDMVLDHSPKER